MKRLEVLVHLSTGSVDWNGAMNELRLNFFHSAYSHCDRMEIGECHYETNPRYEEIEQAEKWMTDEMMTKLTPEILGKRYFIAFYNCRMNRVIVILYFFFSRPNTYTLTKAIGEDIMFKESVDLPVVILRPSIVGAVWNDPIPVSSLDTSFDCLLPVDSIIAYRYSPQQLVVFIYKCVALWHDLYVFEISIQYLAVDAD